MSEKTTIIIDLGLGRIFLTESVSGHARLSKFDACYSNRVDFIGEGKTREEALVDLANQFRSVAKEIEAAAGHRRGRPPGSQNKPKAERHDMAANAKPDSDG